MAIYKQVIHRNQYYDFRGAIIASASIQCNGILFFLDWGGCCVIILAYEKDFNTQVKYQAAQDPWLSSEDEKPGRPRGHPAQKAKRTQTVNGLAAARSPWSAGSR